MLVLLVGGALVFFVKMSTDEHPRTPPVVVAASVSAPPLPSVAPPAIIDAGTTQLTIDGLVYGKDNAARPFDFTFTIFPAGHLDVSTAIVGTSRGHATQDLTRGQYSLCWQGGLPTTPRVAWTAGCQTLEVGRDPVHIEPSVSEVGPSGISFRCAPVSACPPKAP